MENQLKLHTVCPEKLNEIQNEMSLMSELKTNIERADEDVNRLSSELKLAIESACGSTGLVISILLSNSHFSFFFVFTFN